MGNDVYNAHAHIGFRRLSYLCREPRNHGRQGPHPTTLHNPGSGASLLLRRQCHSWLSPHLHPDLVSVVRPKPVADLYNQSFVVFSFTHGLVIWAGSIDFQPDVITVDTLHVTILIDNPTFVIRTAVSALDSPVWVLGHSVSFTHGSVILTFAAAGNHATARHRHPQ